MRRRAPRFASRRGATAASVTLQILDEGDGIPPGELERIFDKFYRAQKGDHVRAGTGLGLAISRGFVEAMRRHDHGRQPHRSAAARYFTITAAGTRRAGADALEPPHELPHRIKVLVIDDEPPIRSFLRMGLSTQGYDIDEAANGKLRWTC